MTTNVPSLVIAAGGVVTPAEVDVLNGALADMNVAYGGNLNINNLETPQGQLASTLAAIIADKNNQILWYVSQVDPMYAEGRMQDAIARIYFITRNPSQATVVTGRCTGQPGVAVPTGALAQAADGTVYTCTSGGVISDAGIVDLTFRALVTGPIPCAIGTLNRPYQTIPGWESITNLTEGIIGRDTENRNDFEVRRNASVAKNAQGNLPSVRGAVLGVTGVLDAFVTENTTSAPITVGGVTLAAHSLYVAAAGGDPQAIGNAIWLKKAVGCDYNGNTTVTVTDPSYSDPKPTYTVKFQVPSPVPIKMQVNIVASLNVPSDAQAQIQNAVLAAFAGTDGGPRTRIGGTVYASRFYAAVAALGSWAQIVSLEVGTTTPNQFSVSTNIDQIPTMAATDVAVALV